MQLYQIFFLEGHYFLDIQYVFYIYTRILPSARAVTNALKTYFDYIQLGKWDNLFQSRGVCILYSLALKNDSLLCIFSPWRNKADNRHICGISKKNHILFNL